MDLWIDFNSVSPEGHTSSLIQFARPGISLVAGMKITVGDADGNTCAAEVVSIDSRGLVEVALANEGMCAAPSKVRARA